MRLLSRVVLLAALFLIAAMPAFAVEPNERLADPALEARARALGGELRCMVCQDTSIDESNAALAHDLRVLLRERLKAGDTDQQVLDFMVARYGRFVLLKPRLEPVTYVLWFGPLFLLLGGGVMLWLRSRRAVPIAEVPLTPEESDRVARLLSSDGMGDQTGARG